MLVTLFGIVMPVRLVDRRNAEEPMLVTGIPFVALGMVIFPPDPVYPVMVRAPLLVAKVNWACIAAGNIKTSSKRVSRVARIGDKRQPIALGLALQSVRRGFGRFILQSSNSESGDPDY